MDLLGNNELIARHLPVMPKRLRKKISARTSRQAQARAAILREGETLYRVLMEQVDDGFFVCDESGRFLMVNSAGCRMLGFKRGELLGRRVQDTYARNELTLSAQRMRQLKAGKSLRFFRAMRRKDGTFLDTDISVTVLPGGLFLGIVRDISEQKDWERAVRESEERFRTLADHAPVGIFLSKPNGDATYVNKQWCQMAGLSAAESLGKGWIKAVHPADRRQVAAGWKEAVGRGGSSSAEFRFLRSNGHITWIHGHATRIQNEQGELIGYVGTVADITKRKRAEEMLRKAHHELDQRVRRRTAALTQANNRLKAEILQRQKAERSLRESEERHRVMVQGVKDYAIYLLDPKGRVASWNIGAERIKGYQADEIMGQSFSRFFPREDARRGKPQRLLRTAMRTGRAEDEGWRVRKDGTRFWALALVTALRDERGRLRGFAKVTRDMTERRRVQEALRESEARLRAILDNIPAMIFLKDRQGRYLHFNRRFEQVFHVSLEKTAGKTDSQIFPPAQAKAFRRNDLRVLKAGVAMAFDEEAEHDDGMHSSIVTKYPLRDAEGKIYAVGGIVTDITERRRAEEALRENEKNLADFFEQAPLGLLWVSPERRIVRVNRAQLELLGCTAKQCNGRYLEEFFADPELATEAMNRLARNRTLQNYRARLVRRDGGIRHVLVDANGHWRDDRLLYSRWFVRDITHRVELEQEILAISEREQRRLGHDLHDDLCQQLSGVEFLSQTLAGQLNISAPEMAARAREIAGIIRHAIDRTRELAQGLSPMRLTDDGLMLALQELAERTKRLFHITCRLRCDAPVWMNDEATAMHLYRIAQEAVSNAIKHGKAGLIEMALSERAGMIMLAVRDNGVGFPVKLRRRRGMGLRVMQYRAGVVGGSLVVQRRVNGGTTVVCTVKTGRRHRTT